LDYSEPYAGRLAGNIRRPFGNQSHLESFSVVLTMPDSGCQRSLNYRQTRQDGIVYILKSSPTLVIGCGEIELNPGRLDLRPKARV
jgi:uncharacterized cupin superfamily protein